MRVLYTRVSTHKQSLERQLHQNEDFGLVIEDRGISGSIPFMERPHSNKLKKMLDDRLISELHTYSIDRLGRNLNDILNTIELFASYKVPIIIKSQGLCTYDVESGDINPTTKLILQIMGSVAEMEKNLIKERIKHSLNVKKLKGELLGRKRGSNESIDKFLNKEKSRKVLKLIKKGLSVREISSVAGCGPQLVQKVRKYANC
jgi:DNA invertase Pin-like site-specific DNA recombinase